MDKGTANEFKIVEKALSERLEKHNEDRKAVQQEIRTLCDDLRKRVDLLEEKLNSKLKEDFYAFDDNLQKTLNDLRIAYKENINEIAKIIKKAKAELLVTQEYNIKKIVKHSSNNNDCDNNGDDDEFADEYDDYYDEMETESDDSDDDYDDYDGYEDYYSDDDYYNYNDDYYDHYDEENEDEVDKDEDEMDEEDENEPIDISEMYELITKKGFDINCFDLKTPVDLKINEIKSGRIYLDFTHLSPDEERVIYENGFEGVFKYIASIRKQDEENEEEYYLKEYTKGRYSSLLDFLEEETTYEVRVRILCGNKKSEWSESIYFTTPKFAECCVWREYPEYVDYDRKKYLIDENNTRIATKNESDFGFNCTVLGSLIIPLNKVTTWSIKILKSKYNNGGSYFIGVASSDIDQNEYCNQGICGWYFDCYNSSLWSGPPHDYNDKEYGPRKKDGEYVRTGDSVGVVMDTTKGILSFIVDKVNLGIAFEGIPLDKPLVPCVILRDRKDSIEIIF